MLTNEASALGSNKKTHLHKQPHRLPEVQVGGFEIAGSLIFTMWCSSTSAQLNDNYVSLFYFIFSSCHFYGSICPAWNMCESVVSVTSWNFTLLFLTSLFNIPLSSPSYSPRLFLFFFLLLMLVSLPLLPLPPFLILTICLYWQVGVQQ